ncbi:MAG: FkbM family methyltransferase [Solirubrobacterales bacterium]|nr:FkbM family methyltransferase [Solirubrobacterales bacterium]MCB8970324.1 FkbM family methyltransferase [Thermoleophilales bacterium]MCO5325487.1 FkbM family methyltransferase [Solirubrobacterales bacterium]
MLRRSLDRLGFVVGILRATAGLRAAKTAILAAAGARGSQGDGRGPVLVPMRELGGESLSIRPGTSDLRNAVAYYSHRIHMPPPGVVPTRAIVELGTNCGVALAALGHAFPDARLLGVEPDPGNVEAARANTARFGDRCEVVNSAVWSESTELVLVPSVEHGDHGITVRPVSSGDDPSWARMSALTIDDVLARHLPDGESVDYMHISIEGSEPGVFDAGGRWPQRVHSLRVEVHPYFGWDQDDCIRQLTDLGYRAWAAPDPPDKWVFAVNEAARSTA